MTISETVAYFADYARSKTDLLSQRPLGHCQTNLNGPAKGAGLRHLGRQLTPLGQGDRTVLFEDVAAVEVAVVVEVVVD